jgi:hypothetical protein
MQVFVPFPQYTVSLGLLDRSRLQKQLIETSQIIDIILGLPTKKGTVRKGWLKHPALLAWKHNPGALIKYLKSNVNMLQVLGYKTDYAQSRLEIYKNYDLPDDPPIWLGDELIHSSHRARLLQKGWEQKLDGQKNADRVIEWYKSFDWPEMQDPMLMTKEYKWPVNIIQSGYDLEERVSKPAQKIKQKLIETYGYNPYITL